MSRLLKVFLLSMLVVGCSVKEQPIDYGKDVCAHCMMTIIDRQHAAEGVTSKGKVMKFDAIECLITYKRVQKIDFELELVNVYDNPIHLFSADSVTYIISEALPSPMGAFLTAYSEPQPAMDFIAGNGGQSYSWQEISSADRIPKP